MSLRLLLLLPFIMYLSVNAADPTYIERKDVQQFIEEMKEKEGLDTDYLLNLLRDIRPNPAILKAIQPIQQNRVKSWEKYRARFINPVHIAQGLEFARRNQTALIRAEAIYGVPTDIIIAIIGIETRYGHHPGRFNVLEALVNLAFDYPPRAELFRNELKALLMLAHEDRQDPKSYRGSFAGAIGLPQFLPSSIRRFAIDFNQNGKIDLSTEPEDAIGSVARFLNIHGWEANGAISFPVQVLADPAPLLAEGIRPQRQVSELPQFGVSLAENAPAGLAALIDLPSPNKNTEYRLGYQNFFVLTRYNRSSFYAAAVEDLAKALITARSQDGIASHALPGQLAP